MFKAGELNWDELYKSEDPSYSHEPSALWAADQHGGGKVGVDPLDIAKPLLKNGEIPPRPSDEEIAEFILKGRDVNGAKPMGQPTDEELFGHLVVSKEELKKAQRDWENKLDDFYKAAQAPVLPVEEQKLEWGDGASFNDTLTDEERLRRNMFTGDE